MKKIKLLTFGLWFASMALAFQPSRAASSSELLQQGLYAEEVEGNIDKAIQAYAQVIQSGSASRNQIAQALYRQGLCYVKTKNEVAARASLERLVTEYQSQTELVEKARPVLEELTDFDPAGLMPSGTMAYVEFGSPGRQVETILGLLKGTPFENPLAAIENSASFGQGSSGDMVGALLNPSMLAEFKKIRGFAWGVTGMALQNPPWIAVLYPGKSDALRGIILAALGMAGKPGESIEGMQTVTIQLPQGQTAIKVAYDDRVILAAQPGSQLAWSVRQYKRMGAEPSLATGNKTFAKVSKSQRQNNALTVWANMAAVYAGVLKTFPDGQVPPQMLAANHFVDFANVESLLLTKSIDATGLNTRVSIQFKEGHHSLGYQMIRTPNISKAPLEAVPASAIAVVSFSLNQTMTEQAETIRDQIRTMSGLDIRSGVFSNIEQITLFVVPPAGSGPITSPDAIPACLGLSLTSRDPAQTREALETLLGSLSGGQAKHPASQFKVGADKNGDMNCYLEQANGILLLSLNRDVLNASLSALKTHKSICSSGPLHAAVGQMPPTTSKLVLASAGGVLHLVSPKASGVDFSEEQLKEFNESMDHLARAADGTVLALRADEQPNDLTLDCAVSGLPPLNQVVGPVSVLTRLNEEAQAAARVRNLRLSTPALARSASRAPVIDGKADEVWNKCPVYTLANSLYAKPSSDKDLSATYRMMWDQSNLYVLVDVTDDVLKHESAADEWYNSDSVEVYIDADDAKAPGYGQNDYQYAFTWDKGAPTIQETKHSRTQGVEYALVTTDKGYAVEAKFPWTTLGVKPSAGSKVGLDVQVNDNDGGGKRKSKLAWHATEDDAWTNPQAFGNAELAGLVGWWKLNENEGSFAADSSGNGNNGTLQGHAAWRPTGGKFGGAIELNGKGDYIKIDNAKPFDIRAQITLSAWVNLQTVPQEWTGIITKGDTAWRASTVFGQNAFHFAVGQDENYLNGQKQINPGEWHHLVCVYDGNTMSTYLDGQLDVSRPHTGPIGANHFPVEIGENAENTGRCWNGRIDDVRIYNYALSEPELRALEASE